MENVPGCRIAGKGRWLRTVPVLLILVLFGAGYFRQNAGWPFALFLVMLAGAVFRIADVFLLGLACGLTVLFKIEPLIRIWPLPFALALIVSFVAGRCMRFARDSFAWLKMGRCGRTECAMVALIALVSGIALAGWYHFTRPDIGDLLDRMPYLSPVALAAVGVGFSIVNASCEEFLWRGMIFSALERCCLPLAGVVVVQALSFGIAHLHGFPRGISGMILAGIYGCMLGALRHRAGGMLAPVAAHLFADLVIYALLSSSILT
ncbi:MAG: type II CAAX endopeptidase family protein [Syntrophobacteraceae bacterium]|nr:CPBP family intramembrane metalloprotease [Desulfobacteraceae bacterium]